MNTIIKLEVANNNQIDDWLKTSKTQKVDFTKNTLELKYSVKSEEALKNFLDMEEKIRESVQEIKRELKFDKIFCRFDFGSYIPSESLQKNLVDFQQGTFDDVTIQMINDDFATFKNVIKYANKKEYQISTFVDLKLGSPLLIQIINYLSSLDLSNTRWKYRKIDTYIDRYRLISSMLQEKGIDCYIVGCRKRCGIHFKECEDIAISVILRSSIFNFKGCCLEYNPLKKDLAGKKRRFIPSWKRFDKLTYEWIPADKSDRYQDYVDLSKLDLSKKEVSKRKKFILLIAYLEELS